MVKLHSIPLGLIDPPSRDVRTHRPQAKVIELAQSIQSIGLLQPIVVVAVGERFRCVIGWTRFLAHQWLGRETIEACVQEAGPHLEVSLSLAENVQRTDMNPVDEARTLRALIDGEGRTVAEVARSQGKSESWVRGRLEILLWPADVVALVAKGEVRPAVMRELVLVEDEEVRAHYLRCCLESGCTAAQMRQWRLDWEVQRHAVAPAAYVELEGTARPFHVIPTAPCAVCFNSLPITAFQFLKVCPVCEASLRTAQAQGGGAALVAPREADAE